MKTSIKYMIIVAIVSLFPVTNGFSQAFHAIIACNTADSSIGVGMSSDLKNMRNEAETIASMLECEDYDVKVFDGATCTKANISQYISDMEVGRDDVILFFYGGHGTHAMNNSNDPWPQMCMNTNIESLFMSVASLDKLITSKQPRLSVIFTNCCNKEQNGISIKPLFAQAEGPTLLSNYNSAVFKTLFLKTKGKVMMTSSKLGQYSWCGPSGGVFTNYLLDAFDEVGTNKISPTWNSVCKSVYEKTSSCVFRDGAKQNPYYVVSTNDNGGGGEKSVRVPRTSDETTLFKALQILLNREYSKDQRLAKVADIKSKYFTSDAHVVTVGRNGTSKIMYEDVDDFLRRLALSDKIKQINVLEGDNVGKSSIITVHEVRY